MKCVIYCRIVLEAGYFMNSVAFFENIITILVYAVIVSQLTTLLTACVNGYSYEIKNFSPYTGYSMECVCFG